MANYKLNENAKADLWRIYQYGFYNFGETQADKYLDDLYEHFELIAQSPYSYQSVDDIKENYRRCVCGVDSIYFIIQHGVIEIMAIIGRQDHTNYL